MKLTLHQIYTTINSANYSERYDHMRMDDGKVHVLYISPLNNGTGLYRAVIPMVEMNKSTTHSAVINQIESAEQQGKDIETPISDGMIRWAHYIVFQTSFHNLAEDIETLKTINSKLKFVMDIDDNYHVPVPGQNERYANTMRDQLLQNMAACDIITCSTLPLAKFYFEKLQQFCTDKNIASTTTFKVLPNLMSNDCYQGLTRAPRPSSKIRIGMSFNPTQFMDVNPFRKVLIEVNKKYGDKVELISFGWSGKIPKPFKNAMEGVQFTHVQPVPVTDYFQALINLHFDFCLMPLQDNEFNRCKTHHKLLQYSQIGIPAICSDVQPYNEIIAEAINPDGSTDDTYFLPHFKVKTNDEWLQKIDYLVRHPDARKGMSYYANAYTQQNYTWHTANGFTEFFPNY